MAGPENGRQRVQPLAKRDIRLIGDDLEGGMGEVIKLVAHCLDHLRMPMAGVENGDAAAEIDIAVAVDVPQFRTFGVVRQKPDRQSIRRAGWRPSAGTGAIELLVMSGLFQKAVPTLQASVRKQCDRSHRRRSKISASAASRQSLILHKHSLGCMAQM